MAMRTITRLALLALAGYAVSRAFGMMRRSAEYSKSTWRERQAMKKRAA